MRRPTSRDTPPACRCYSAQANEVMKALGRQWKAMPPHLKKPYEQQAEQSRKEYWAAKEKVVAEEKGKEEEAKRQKEAEKAEKEAEKAAKKAAKAAATKAAASEAAE